VALAFLPIFLAGCAGTPPEPVPAVGRGSIRSVDRPAPAITFTFPLNQGDLDSLANKLRFTISGTARKDVARIDVQTCKGGDAYRLAKFKPGDTTWTYNIDAQLGNLCSGWNTYTVTAFADDNATQKLGQAETAFESRARVLQLEALQTGQTGSLDKQKAVQSVVFEDSQAFDEYCANFGDFDAQLDTYPELNPPALLTPMTPIGDGLWARVRSGTKADASIAQGAFVSSRKHTVNSPTLVFYEKDGERYKPRPDIGIVSSWGCPFTHPISVTYVRPDRIFVETGTGFETSQHTYIFDGKNWTLVYDFLKAKVPFIKDYAVPLDIRVTPTHFTLKETHYCCDDVQTLHPDKWTEYAFDMDTFELVDVAFHDRTERGSD